jgi:hypothetical protein
LDTSAQTVLRANAKTQAKRHVPDRVAGSGERGAVETLRMLKSKALFQVETRILPTYPVEEIL